MKRLMGTLVGVISLGLGLAGLTPLVYGHGGDTSLIHACVKKNGALRTIAADGACKKNETALDWSISGTPGPQGPQGPSGPAGPTGATGPTGPAAPTPLAVYDANNVFVGAVVGINSAGGTIFGGPRTPFVAMMVDDIAYVLGVSDVHFVGNYHEVGFETANCSGLPYMAYQSPIPATMVVGNIVYVADNTGPIVDVSVGSLLVENGTCILASGVVSQLYPAVKLDLGALFAPPYKIR